MDILVISDTHGRPSRIIDLLARQIKKPDAIFFLGDGYADVCRALPEGENYFCVRGNCDFFDFGSDGAPPAERLICYGGCRIFMTHGNSFGVGSGIDRAAAYAAEKDADLLLFGHTHVRCDDFYPEGTEFCGKKLKKPLRVFNPGSLGEPRDGKAPSFGILTINDGVILTSHGEL